MPTGQAVMMVTVPDAALDALPPSNASAGASANSSPAFSTHRAVV